MQSFWQVLIGKSQRTPLRFRDKAVLGVRAPVAEISQRAEPWDPSDQPRSPELPVMSWILLDPSGHHFKLDVVHLSLV